MYTCRLKSRVVTSKAGMRGRNYQILSFPALPISQQQAKKTLQLFFGEASMSSWKKIVSVKIAVLCCVEWYQPLSSTSPPLGEKENSRLREQWLVVKRDITTYLYFLIGNLAFKVTPPCMFMIRNHRYHFPLLGFSDLSINLTTQESIVCQIISALLGEN